MSDLHLTKYYSSPFVLDKGKLARISSILSKAHGQDHTLSYLLHFKTGRKLNLPSLDDATSLDNTMRDPIVALTVDSHGKGGSANVDFTSDDSYLDVKVTIWSSDNDAANDLYGALDEQVDRTLVKGLVSRLASSVIGRVVLTIVLAVSFISVVCTTQLSLIPAPSAPSQTVESTLAKRAQTARSDHDKLQIIFEKTVNDLQPNTPVQPAQPMFTARSAFIALPAAIIVLVLIYMLWTCYPLAVFAWGDWEQHYRNILKRRQVLWTVVVVATILGVVSNLFVVSLPAFR